VANDNEKDTFYEELERLFDLLPKYNTKIVLDDFNAKVGRGNYRHIKGNTAFTKSSTTMEKDVTFGLSKTY